MPFLVFGAELGKNGILAGLFLDSFQIKDRFEIDPALVVGIIGSQ